MLALVILAVAAVAILRWTYPDHRLKQLALDYTKKNFNREVTFDKISLGIKGLTLTNFALSEESTFQDGTFIKAEQLRKKMLVGEALPQVGIGVQGGYSNFFDKDRWNGAAFAFVRIPLTQWWETGHKIKEQKLRIAQAQLMQEDLMGKMKLQNEQAYNQLNEAARIVAESESALQMAQDNYDMSLMNYEAGMATMSELLESQALLLQAQNSYTDARISYRAAQRKFNSFNK